MQVLEEIVALRNEKSELEIKLEERHNECSTRQFTTKYCTSNQIGSLSKPSDCHELQVV